MIRVRNLAKTYRTEHEEVGAVRGVSFEVAEGEFYTLLGPSGCGKTTILRCIAGLERPDSGEIQLAQTTVFSADSNINVPPEKRGTGMVFQSYAIWPHMTVFDNVAFPLRESAKRLTRSQIRERVNRVLDLVRLTGLNERAGAQLSGGQQQRLALARALVAEPKVLLLDEPLSNLDAKLRGEMRVELRELQRRLQITTLYVTHDQVEALSMSNRIAVLREGRIVQADTPHEVYQRPSGSFVARFMGSTNLVPGILTRGHDLAWAVETEIGTFTSEKSVDVRAGDRVLLTIQPINVVVHREMNHAANVVRGKVELTVFCGDYVDCHFRVGTQLIYARQHPAIAPRQGEEVYLELPPQHCIAVAEDS
ncbi:MAG TPA: ABC transporter ATP-binding protein [Candidatus Acidoferrales bacterium]|nr:ABC transporter ATP-binding protein [Candidatus Acidoferrales bacterium]